MATTAVTVASAILLAPALLGQEPPPQEEARVFQLTRAESVQDAQEVATIIRSIADIRHVLADQKAIALRAAPARMAAAEWLIDELDRRVPGRPRSQTLSSGEHRLMGTDSDVLRIFFLAQSSVPHELQELATVIRSLGDIRWTFTYNRPMAIVIRGTRAQLALTEWLVKELDRPENRQEALRRNLSAVAQEYGASSANR
jgi:hypothetical protein